MLLQMPPMLLGQLGKVERKKYWGYLNSEYAVHLVQTPLIQNCTVTPACRSFISEFPTKKPQFSGLSAALQRQQDEFAEVRDLLGNLSLDRYVSVFEEHG